MTRTATRTTTTAVKVSRVTIGVAAAASRTRRNGKHTLVSRRSVPNVLTRAAKRRAAELQDNSSIEDLYESVPDLSGPHTNKPGEYVDDWETQDFPPDPPEYEDVEYYSDDPEETAKEDAAFIVWAEQAVESHFDREHDAACGK